MTSGVYKYNNCNPIGIDWNDMNVYLASDRHFIIVFPPSSYPSSGGERMIWTNNHAGIISNFPLMRSTPACSHAAERWKGRCNLSCWLSGVYDVVKLSLPQSLWRRNILVLIFVPTDSHRVVWHNILNCKTYFIRPLLLRQKRVCLSYSRTLYFSVYNDFK